MTLETIATLALIASRVVLTAISFWIGWKLGKEAGYLEAEYEIAAIASEETEKRKQSSPFTLAEPEEGEWILWDGGACPVDMGKKVDVKYRDGEVRENIPAGMRASAIFWLCLNTPQDIIAYRLSK